VDVPIIAAHGLGKLYRISSEPRAHSLSDRVAHAFRGVRREHSAKHPLRELWALRDVSFEVRRGEVLGVIGPNGAGKSTLLSVLARITDPTEGYAELRGRVSSLLEVGTGFHPELSGRDNVFLNGAVLGMSRAETASKFDEIVAFSGVGDFIDMPVKRYSSGMYVRLAFAVAAHLDPEILILDEVLAVGDRAFQEKCLARIHEIVDSGRAVVFVSHDVASVARLCNRGLVLNSGRIAYLGDVDEAVAVYLASTPLGGDDHHESREGTGELRIEKVTVTNAGGGRAVTANQPVRIRIDVSGTEPVAREHLRLRLGIQSTLGGTYIALSTDFDPSRPLDHRDLESGATIVCEVDELPLKPGSYTVSAVLERSGGDIIDRVTDQAVFAVVPTDFFGTGVIVGETHPAPVLVRHRWHVVASDAGGLKIGEATR
jgi:lipopolysaccharide transport system ATP-binding protein